jgi:hypothetical protein
LQRLSGPLVPHLIKERWEKDRKRLLRVPTAAETLGFHISTMTITLQKYYINVKLFLKGKLPNYQWRDLLFC